MDNFAEEWVKPFEDMLLALSDTDSPWVNTIALDHNDFEVHRKVKENATDCYDCEIPNGVVVVFRTASWNVHTSTMMMVTSPTVPSAVGAGRYSCAETIIAAGTSHLVIQRKGEEECRFQNQFVGPCCKAMLHVMALIGPHPLCYVQFLFVRQRIQLLCRRINKDGTLSKACDRLLTNMSHPCDYHYPHCLLQFCLKMSYENLEILPNTPISKTVVTTKKHQWLPSSFLKTNYLLWLCLLFTTATDPFILQYSLNFVNQLN